MRNYILIALSFFIINYANAENITVGVKQAVPFTYLENGEWKGISIEFMDQLSKEVGFTYSIVSSLSLPELIISTKNENVDMAIAAISLTSEREKVIDFSHSYFTTSLGILSKKKASTSENVFWMLKKVAVILVILIVMMYVVGFIISRADKGGDIDGIHEGAWCALVTFSTTGYGDEVPKTDRGKVVVSMWIIASLFLISIFTGYVSSAMTVKKLSETTTTLADLYDVEVNVVGGTTSELRLAELGIDFNVVGSLDEAIENFKSGEADVVVHDKAMLDYATKDLDNVDVWQIDNSDEYYAIAFPTGSKLSEKVNLGILKVLTSPKWKAIKINYLGAE